MISIHERDKPHRQPLCLRLLFEEDQKKTIVSKDDSAEFLRVSNSAGKVCRDTKGLANSLIGSLRGGYYMISRGAVILRTNTKEGGCKAVCLI